MCFCVGYLRLPAVISLDVGLVSTQLYEEYDDEEIGALDHDDISGCVQQGSHLLNTALEDFEKSQNTP